MTAKTDSPIQTVGIAGRGAIGLLYGMQMRSGGVEPWYIADEERIWRYRQDPVPVNGIPQTFRYLQPGTTGNESAGDSHADLSSGCNQFVAPTDIYPFPVQTDLHVIQQDIIFGVQRKQMAFLPVTAAVRQIGHGHSRRSPVHRESQRLGL